MSNSREAFERDYDKYLRCCKKNDIEPKRKMYWENYERKTFYDHWKELKRKARYGYVPKATFEEWLKEQ